jgi:hypothetical protein
MHLKMHVAQFEAGVFFYLRTVLVIQQANITTSEFLVFALFNILPVTRSVFQGRLYTEIAQI